MPASDAYDVVVVGAGAGGMTAAAVAAAEGLSVLVIEKTEFVGGTTAWSGGMVWIPVNTQMKQAGLPDNPSAAADYLASTVPEPENVDLRDTFLSRGPEAIDYLEANTEVRLQPVKVYPDYYPDMPGATAGGRVLEPVSFDGTNLGKRFGRLRPPLPEFTLFGGMMVNRSDIPHFANSVVRSRSTLRSLRLISRYALQRLRAPRGTTLHLGNALAARLYASLLARNVEILFGASVEQLLIDGDAVGGVRITGSSGVRSIAARKGVVLATGGFSHDAGLRETVLSRCRWFCLRHGACRDGRRFASCDGRRRQHRHARCGSRLLGAGVIVSADGWQPGRFPAHGHGPGEARRHRDQRVGQAFRQ